jgi:hypothetical protein
MNATSSTPVPLHSPWEAPPPVLLNVWKHHAGAIRRRVAAAAAAGPAALADLPGQLVVVGTELMDLYTGTFTPADIAAKVLAALRAEGRLEPEAYRAWVEEGGNYRVLTFPEDGSRWTLRRGDEARYVHVHPGRWSPATRRVRANVLKTAVMVLAYTAVHGGDPRDVVLVNAVRARYLGLSPMRELAGEGGLGAVIDALESA